MRIVHAADIHLDSPLAGMARRQPELEALVRTCTRDAFTNLVDAAITNEADVLLIAGDLYDAEQRNYETGLFFAREMQRLSRPCVVIHGNHDSASQITKSLQPPPNVTILPARRPDTAYFPELGLAVHGQSFGSRAEAEELAGSYPKRVEGAFNVGLLHSSMENPGQHARYAPCRVGTLLARNYDYWALGHIHTRATLHEAPWIHFPGNIQGRHVRETGPRGATLVEVDDDHRVRSLTFLPTDVLRWAVADIDASGHGSMEALTTIIRFELDVAARAAEGRPVVVRIVLRGQTPLHAALLADPADIDAQCRAAATAIGPDVHVEAVKLRTTPASQAEDMVALEQAVRSALTDPATAAGLLADFGRLRNTLPAGSEVEVPQTAEGLALLVDDAWEILRHTLGSAQR
ncbi:DNA repair exonuclease [Acidisphaera sp. L21]|uniref:metallophosphoesterase family protein n=1 Tax=Acidisphaera sp. L21 TaxID=1641851 RepID=UPI00131D68A1|nr:DNA repair exonuclease [Acidisphaera sp. L21]